MKMKQNTHQNIARFICSQRTVDLETQKRVINLGKALVNELGLDPGVDTLARWMAHYIAEQIELAQSTIGDDRDAVEQRCFDTILKLWEHRSSLPNGQRPFENFEPIFRALTRLDPEGATSYFYDKPSSHSPDSDILNTDTVEVQKWLNIADVIDQAARTWLEYVFYQAALSATDDKTITWLENALDVHHNKDIAVILRLYDVDREDEVEQSNGQKQRIKQEKLRSRIKQLDAFIHFSKELRATYEAELGAMKQDDSLIYSDDIEST